MRTIVDDVYWLPDEPSGGFRVAVRWTQVGTHEGPAVVVSDTVFSVEYTEWGEFALIKQIATPAAYRPSP